MPGETHCDEYHGAGPNGPPKASPYWPKMMAQTDDAAHAKGIMMRGQRYKYVSRSVGPDELYDLERDPGETCNLIDDGGSADLVASMRLDMLKWLQATADIVPYEFDQRFTPEMMWARVRHLLRPEDEPAVRDMIANHVGFAKLMQYCKALAHSRQA